MTKERVLSTKNWDGYSATQAKCKIGVNTRHTDSTQLHYKT